MIKQAACLLTNLVSKFLLAKQNPVILLMALSLAIGASQSSALAVSFKVTSMETKDGDNNYTFSSDNTGQIVTPEGYNNVTSFTVDRTETESVVENITIPTANKFFALRTDGVTTRYPIQPKFDPVNGGPLNGKLYNDDDDYLSAGANGLSLSTGVNKISSQAVETLIFPVVYIDPSKVDDGMVDFFAADIAFNQSPDTWNLLDEQGAVVASLITEGNIASDPGDHDGGNDWTELGKQNVNRWDNQKNQLDTKWGNTSRSVSAIAFELADFDLVTGANWANVRSMEIIIADETDIPRTDYAFIASNTDSIRFANQVHAPEPLTILGSFTALGFGGLFKRKFSKKKNSKQDS